MIAALVTVIMLLNPQKASVANGEERLSAPEYVTTVKGVERLVVRNAVDEFIVIAGEVPGVQGYETVPMNIDSLARLLHIAGALRSQRMIAETADDARFGLAEPRATLTLYAADQQQTLLIGDAAPGGNYVYVKTATSPRIHLAALDDIAPYLRRAIDFVSLDIVPATTARIDRVTLSGAVRQNAVVIIENRDATQGDAAYWLIQPITAVLSANKGYTLLRSLSAGLVADRVAAVGNTAVLDSAGLHEPYSTISVSDGQDGNYTLKASAPDSVGNVYLASDYTQRENAPPVISVVYQLPASRLPWLEATWFDLTNKLIVLPHIDTLAAVELTTLSGAVSFMLSGAGDELRVKASTQDIDTAKFRVYYQTLIAARYDEYADVSELPSAAPFLEIVYRYRSGSSATDKSDRVSFYATDSRRVLSSLNGGRLFYTYLAYTDKVIADLALLLAGQAVQPYL